MMIFQLLLALLLDKCFAEPKRFHPLVGFGHLANSLEKTLNTGSWRKARGCVALALAILPLVGLAYYLQQILAEYTVLMLILSAAIVYLAIGWQSLLQHAEAIRAPLCQQDLAAARQALAMIVSRDTEQLDESEIAKGCCESLLENGADAIFSALCWFLLAGIPGVLMYRLSNTLDAMWGYKNPRFKEFGWAAARLDDLLNYLPARLTALSYACVGNFRQAIASWRAQASSWKSPNAGPVMAAGAGAINTALGGDASYFGESQQRAALGPSENAANMASAQTIAKACALVNRALMLWVTCIVLFTLFSRWLSGASLCC